MDIRQLRYFIAIVEERSFSNAARKLHVAQPALSQHMLALEAAIGVKLLHRNARATVPTEEGVRLLERARKINSDFLTINEHVRGVSDIPCGEVRFGLSSTISEMIGGSLIELSRLKYPKIRIRLFEAMSGFVLDWLRKDVVDVAIISNAQNENGLVLHCSLVEEIKLFGAMEISTALHHRCIDFLSATHLPLILPGKGHGLRDHIDAAAQTVGGDIRPEMEIDSYKQIKELVARNLGFSMLPTTAIDNEVRSGSFRTWEVVRPALMRRVYLGYSAIKPLSLASRAVAQLSWDVLQEGVRAGKWAAKLSNDIHPNLYPK